MQSPLRFLAASLMVAGATAALTAQQTMSQAAHQHQMPAARADGTGQFGTGVTLAEATPIAALYASPDAFVGKTVRLDGVVSAVCEEMGCWMALASDTNPEQTVRFKVDHGGSIVFPISARGKKASAQGVLERIAATDMEAKEAAAEQGKSGQLSDFGTQYQIKATGAVIR